MEIVVCPFVSAIYRLGKQGPIELVSNCTLYGRPFYSGRREWAKGGIGGYGARSLQHNL